MILVTAKYLVPKGYASIALYPFILLRSKAVEKNATLINHERIHLRQQAELLVVPFYIWYGSEFLIRLTFTGDRKKAYRSISFEKEAYSNEAEPNYLKARPFWNFLNYISAKK